MKRTACAAMGLLAVGLPAQDQSAAAPVVAVLGASVSDGYIDRLTGDREASNESLALRIALEAVYQGAAVRGYASQLMFTDAVQLGSFQVGRALRAEPVAVFAVDFLFWYGYGSVATGEDEAQARRAQLQLGLAQLERFDCPVVVGDLPDMREADARILSPSQVPSVEVLAALNDDVRAWARARDDVAYLPLAQWLDRLLAGEETAEVGGEVIAFEPDLLLQSDRLHATRLGVVLLAHRAASLLAPVLAEDHPLAGPLPELEVLLRRTRTDIDLELSAQERPTAGAGAEQRSDPQPAAGGGG